MQNKKDYIKRTQNYEHSLKFLKDIIINIEAYPELSKLENKFQKKDRVKLKESNILKIKKYLNKLDSLLRTTKDKTNDININKRLEAINDLDLISIYEKEKKLIEKKIINIKNKLKKELKKLDKNLNIYIKAKKNKKGYSITETLNNKTTINELFKKITIDDLIKDLKLEDYEEYFFKEYDSKNLDSKYYKLYKLIDKKEKEKLRESVYPKLKILKTLNKLDNDKYINILNEGYLISDLLIKKKQLKNLLEYINKKSYKYTTIYINNQVNKINYIYSQKNEIIEQELKREISGIDLSKDSLSQLDKELLYNILNSSKIEFENKLNYKNNSILYQEVLQDSLENYQENTLNEMYNLNLSLEKTKRLLHQKSKKKINKKK